MGYDPRLENRIEWRNASRDIAAIAQRSGFCVRALGRHWQVWATDKEFSDLCQQS